MPGKKNESKVTFSDFVKGGVPSPSGVPIPKPPLNPTLKAVREKEAKYHTPPKTEKK